MPWLQGYELDLLENQFEADVTKMIVIFIIDKNYLVTLM